MVAHWVSFSGLRELALLVYSERISLINVFLLLLHLLFAFCVLFFRFKYTKYVFDFEVERRREHDSTMTSVKIDVTNN
jgi:hypothetical protein